MHLGTQVYFFRKPNQSSGGVKLEFVRNSFNSIRKLVIRLIRKGKKVRIRFENF